MQQPGAANSGLDVGPSLYSGLWVYMYAAALDGTGSDTTIWIANRAVGGKACDATGPTDFGTCVPSIWYAQLYVIEADVFFKPRMTNEEVVFNTDISAAFPAIVVNSNGSVAIQFAYSSAFAGEDGIVAESGEVINIYPGRVLGLGVCGLGLGVEGLGFGV